MYYIYRGSRAFGAWFKYNYLELNVECLLFCYASYIVSIPVARTRTRTRTRVFDFVMLV